MKQEIKLRIRLSVNHQIVQKQNLLDSPVRAFFRNSRNEIADASFSI